MADFWTVLAETKRIVNAHSRHFLALSVIFLLPLSFSLIVYPAVQQLVTQSNPRNTVSLLGYSPHLHDPSVLPTSSIILILVYTVFVVLFSLLAAGSITYSVYQGFYGRPVKLMSAIKSGFASFLPLLITVVVSMIIVSGIHLVFGLFWFLVIRGIQLMGLQIEYSSPYLVGFLVVLLLILSLVLVCVQVNWTLVCAVSVVESTWGFQPLKRSTSLIKGMKGLALSLLLVFGFTAGSILWGSSVSAVSLPGTGDGWLTSCAFVVHIVVTSASLMLIMFYNIATNTVLYMHCKAIHGELAGEIAEEFARDYVSLPFDDGKGPYLVSVAYSA